MTCGILPGMSDIQSIRNLGPAMERAFARAGILTAEQLRDLGADRAYRAAMDAGMQAHFAGFMSLCMGLQGRPWNDAAPVEKAELRNRFDSLKAERHSAGVESQGLPHELGAFLDQLGLRARA